MEIGERIKHARKNKNLTQKQLAQKIHVSSQVMSNFERGYTEISAEQIKNIAEVLDVTADYLLGKTNIPDKNPNYWELNNKDEKFIEARLEELINDLGSNEAIAFSKDDEIDEETKQLLVQSLENSLRLGKMMAKKKYTPKKYRNED
ncbi:helix-turn-helix domain-containing protein [Listeria booriae]|uniref:helix-turn-helix domain-containing protein n=1 Tax=Listeria booriae TaxID=1552123 RepID=UPI00162486DB|nr:helix-turn-helix transcriptional regulator [Listeria booriae]MBC2148135.1 helix-turn-helix transcriptional regulator [Listeria booriae]